MNTSSRPTLRLRATVWRLWFAMLLLHRAAIIGLELGGLLPHQRGILKRRPKKPVPKKSAQTLSRLKTSDATQLFFTRQSLAQQLLQQ